MGQLGPGFEGVVSDAPPPHPGSSAGGNAEGSAVPVLRRRGSGRLGTGLCLPRRESCRQCAVSLILRNSLDCLGFTGSTWNALSLPL